MNTVFPVELECLESDENILRFQAFTRDVSAGGLCLELKILNQDAGSIILSLDRILKLTINPVFSHSPILAVARVVWVQKEENTFSAPKYYIGVAYTEIEAKSRERLIRHAHRRIWFPRLAGIAALLILITLGGLFIRHQEILRQNKQLVQRLVEDADEKSGISSQLYQLQKRKAELEKELLAANQKMEKLNRAVSVLTQENLSHKKILEDEILRGHEKQIKIDEELKKVTSGQEKLRANYERLADKGLETGTRVLEQMADWMSSHQNLNTGLVASFEGDEGLKDWAFTYDQSLACQTFILFNRIKSAQAILNFFNSRAEKKQNIFFNAYDAVGGTPVERAVHAGPNIWIGIAALQYQQKTKDTRFLPLAVRIGEWLIGTQDDEGGIPGGPGLTWYSTEHNLDGYAFFKMLHSITGNIKYKTASDRTLEWIKKYAYSVKERRINRGKGDATIATDTFSWAVAAIGPETLYRMGFDTEEIMDFAEKNCLVKVDYVKSNGSTISVKGFDFSKAEHVGRGGIISTEWTAQAIVTYGVLAGYFSSLGDKNKMLFYRDKADFYLNELQKLLITSPSRTGQGRGCLPYASTDNVDTGHGWRTPQGKRTGCVAGTAYGIFAWTGYNPFDLNSAAKLVDSEEGDAA